jgi:hypothetical protein
MLPVVGQKFKPPHIIFDSLRIHALLDSLQEFLGVRGKHNLLVTNQAILEKCSPDSRAVIVVDSIHCIVEDDNRAVFHRILCHQDGQS